MLGHLMAVALTTSANDALQPLVSFGSTCLRLLAEKSFEARILLAMVAGHVSLGI